MDSLNEDLLRGLAEEPGVRSGAGDAPAVLPPVALISARAATLTRHRAIRRGTLAAGLCAVLAATVVQVGHGGALQVREADPAGVRTAVRPPSPSSSGVVRPRLPVLAVADKVACGAWGPNEAVDAPVQSWSSIDRAPGRLLYLPSAQQSGAPDSVTGGRIQCFPVSWLYQWHTEDAVAARVRPTGPPSGGTAHQVPVLQVGGPDSGQPCATADRANWPFGGSSSTVQARGTQVSLFVRADGRPRLCARWTEPDGHQWYALTETTDTTQVVSWLGALNISGGKLDAARSRLPGLPVEDAAIGAYQPQPSGAARTFVESHGTAAGHGGGYSLVGLDGGDPVTRPASAVTVAVGDRPGWWLASGGYLVWQDSRNVWWALRTEGTQDDAVRLAVSLAPVPVHDDRWRVYLSTANGYEGTPVPSSGG